MKQMVIFTLDDLDVMRVGINYALWHLRNKKPLLNDDCDAIERQLENVQKILYGEDDRNE